MTLIMVKLSLEYDRGLRVLPNVVRQLDIVAGLMY
jgi:hypothetical protein